MENPRAIGLVVPLIAGVVLQPHLLFAYERDTHKGISQATVAAYESLSGETFDSFQTEQIVQGSFDEDDGSRPLNHFFDPINGRGLSVFFNTWPPSRVWAQNTEAQANYCDWGFCSKRVGYNDLYFSSATDYSWDRALYEYVYGDKNRGLRSLGHILHLLQDSSVPAHVRNDQHLNHEGVGDPDSYEKFSGQFGLGQIKVPENLGTIQKYESLDEYISAMALYTNQGFVSKDTLFKNYESPSLASLNLGDDNFVYDRIDGHKVAYVQVTHDTFGQPTYTDKSLDDPGGLVLKDYWTYLSREAIRNGVGVIDFFFREVEREKKTHTIEKKNTSEAERRAKNLALKGFSLVKKLYGSSLTEEDVAELTGSSPAAAIQALPNPSVVEEPSKVLQISKQKATEESKIKDVPSKETSKGTAVQNAATSSPSVILPKKTDQELFPVPQGGGGGAPTTASTSTQPQDVTVPTIGLPLADSSHNEASILVSGTSDAGFGISVSYQENATDRSSTTTVANDGTWSVAITPTEGQIQLSVTAVDLNGRTSVGATRSFSVDRTAPDVSGFSVFECSHSLKTSGCAVMNQAHLRIASSSLDMRYFAALVDGTATATSSNSEIQVSLAAGSHNLAVVAYDAAGNTATSTAVSVESLEMPIAINEVAWSGTNASPDSQWIELYNRSSDPISLSSVALSIGTAEPVSLSGTISGESFFLIERTETDTSVASDFVYPFQALTSMPVAIALAYAPGGQATTTIDSTPVATACSGNWCGGTNDTARRSMERTQPNTLGSTPSNWNPNDGFWRNGNDANGAALNASPKKQNSQSLSSIGYFCEPDTVSFIEGGYYQFGNGTQGRCTYESSNFGGNRFGALFIGTVGSSTAVSSHYLGVATSKFEFESALTSPTQGMDMFAVIFVPRFGSVDEDTTAFTNFFQTGTAPPTLSYGIIRFKWGVSQ